jgi:hypothetical protein
VSLDSIPVAQRDADSRGPRAPAGTRPTRVQLEEEPAQAPAEPPPERSAAKQETVELEETPPKRELAVAMTAAVTPSGPGSAAPASAPPVVELEEQEAKPPPPMSERQQFSLGAARSALASATNRANSCKSPDGPSGQGRATITFSPDGPVSSVSLSAPFSGTPVGACVSSAFRSAKVPAFTGSSVTLPQAFRIQ